MEGRHCNSFCQLVLLWCSIEGIDKNVIFVLLFQYNCAIPPKKTIPLVIISSCPVSLFWAIISDSIRPTAHDVSASSQAPRVWSWGLIHFTFSWSKPHHSPLFRLPNLHLSPLVGKPLKKKKKERSLLLCCFQRGIEVKRENQIRLSFGRSEAREAAH